MPNGGVCVRIICTSHVREGFSPVKIRSCSVFAIGAVFEVVERDYKHTCLPEIMVVLVCMLSNCLGNHIVELQLQHFTRFHVLMSWVRQWEDVGKRMMYQTQTYQLLDYKSTTFFEPKITGAHTRRNTTQFTMA